MGMVPITAGEIFWLRLLLTKKVAYSFEELRTVNGVDQGTFQKAAEVLKLVTDREAADAIFAEAIVDCGGHELRVLFTNMTLQGFPTLHIYDNSDLREKMSEDITVRNPGMDIRLVTNRLLQELEKLFKSSGTAVPSDYGLPKSQNQQSELDIEALLYPVPEQETLAIRLAEQYPLTDQMVNIRTIIDTALQYGADHDAVIVLIQGEAGTGKSKFVEYIMAYVRGQGFIAKGCASTGLAAAVYPDFLTAHALFAIPVLEDEEEYDQEGDVRCNLDLSKHAERKELLEKMKLCAWDEISSQHMRDINAVMNHMDNFKGKILLLVGDGLQITPVIPFGTKAAICASSIYCSPIMDTANYIQLTQPMRLVNPLTNPQQANYVQLLRRIARNDCNVPPVHIALAHPEPAIVDVRQLVNSTRSALLEAIAHLPSHTEPVRSPLLIQCSDERRKEGVLQVGIPEMKYFTDKTAAVNFCHPDGFNNTNMHESCILAVTNTQVDEWNAAVQDLNPNPVQTLLSDDKIDECDDPHNYLKNMVTQDVLNRFEDPSNAPPHELKLKRGDICILMRAVSKTDKMTTNTRVRILGISNFVIRVCSLDPDKPTYAYIPRFLFKMKLPYGKSFKITRRQFPLRLAYSLTINRAQGQTLNRCLLDLTRHCFSHGQVNVGFSRIREVNNMAVYIDATQDYDEINELLMTSNVVYPEILAALQRN